VFLFDLRLRAGPVVCGLEVRLHWTFYQSKSSRNLPGLDCEAFPQSGDLLSPDTKVRFRRYFSAQNGSIEDQILLGADGLAFPYILWNILLWHARHKGKRLGYTPRKVRFGLPSAPVSRSIPFDQVS